MRIGLLGTFGGGNLGCDSTQQAMIENIRKYDPDAKIYGFSRIPEDTEWRHGIPSFPIQRPVTYDPEASEWRLVFRLSSWIGNHRNPNIRKLERWVTRVPMEYGLIRQANENIKNIDILIISGGGQLFDSKEGPFSHPYTVLKFATLARLNGAKVYFVSVGAGPIKSGLSKLFIKRALKLSCYLSYRDQAAKEFIDGIGFHADDPVYPDLAFSLSINNYCQQSLQANKNLKVGIGPMIWHDRPHLPENYQQGYQLYLEKVAEFVIWLIEQQYVISLIPGEAAHDSVAIDDLLTILEKRGVPTENDQIVRCPINTVDDLMRELGTLDLFVGSRYHGVILSTLLNKPILALAYHPKMDALMNNLGQGQYCLQLDNFDVEKLKELFNQSISKTKEIKETISHQISQYQAALDEQYRHLFSSQ